MTIRRQNKTVIQSEYEATIFPVEVSTLPDCYDILVHHQKTGKSLAIDPGTEVLIEALKEQKRDLDYILLTHAHYDHVQGVQALRQAFPKVKVYGSQDACAKIQGCELASTPSLKLEGFDFEVMALPGHTLDHLGFFLKEAAWLFSGDVIFPLSCGRLFEGTAEMMQDSFKKLSLLPLETMLFPGHEYLLANVSFGMRHIDPSLLALYQEDLRKLLDEGTPAVPFALGREMQASPFFKFLEEDLKFAALRQDKDQH